MRTNDGGDLMGALTEKFRKSSGDDVANRSATFLLAFIIGTLVGVGLGVTWVPERRRQRLAGIGERYQRLRAMGRGALGDLGRAGRDLAGDFREELSASLEAAREEFADMTRQQLKQARKALERERKRLRS